MKRILGFISLFTIFLLALSACTAETTDPELAIELTVAGNTENIAMGTVAIAQGGNRQFTATLRQGDEAVSGSTFAWELVDNTGSPTRRGAIATSSSTGATVTNDGLVTILLEVPAVADSLRLNVTTTHDGQEVRTHAVINVTASTPTINITPNSVTIAATANVATVEASLAGGLTMTGNFDWELVYADGGAPVPQVAATITPSSTNNHSALVSIVDRALLTSEALRLRVTASGAIANYVLINVTMPQIQVSDL